MPPHQLNVINLIEDPRPEIGVLDKGDIQNVQVGEDLRDEVNFLVPSLQLIPVKCSFYCLETVHIRSPVRISL